MYRLSGSDLQASKFGFACTGVDLAEEQCSEPILKALGQQKISLLMLVAGLQHYDTLATMSRQHVREQFEVNAVGPLFLVQTLQQHLTDSSKARTGLRCCTCSLMAHD